ncbi:nitrogen fixation protein NifX [Alteromonadaceae bacterium Bs31]|nr:nitrogen fixation protein NifX [Alteromonadaceae bacterium Bs31]
MANITRQFSIVGKEDQSLGLKVAFASDDGKNVNQHFGSSRSILIYTLTPDTAELTSVAEFSPLGEQETDDKLAVKMKYLEGCAAVYCRACGASAIRQLLEQHIQPLKVVEDVSIKDLIKAFQRELLEGPANWLARAIGRQQNGSHEFEMRD